MPHQGFPANLRSEYLDPNTAWFIFLFINFKFVPSIHGQIIWLSNGEGTIKRTHIVSNWHTSTVFDLNAKWNNSKKKLATIIIKFELPPPRRSRRHHQLRYPYLTSGGSSNTTCMNCQCGYLNLVDCCHNELQQLWTQIAFHWSPKCWRSIVFSNHKLLRTSAHK